MADFSNVTAPATPPVTVTWGKFRGPGAVTFEKSAIVSGQASTSATFSEAGDYVVLLVANDWSGDGGRGFQCCWTILRIPVTVRQ